MRPRVLAAVDDDTAAHGVLTAARGFGRLLGLDASVVHVSHDRDRAVEALAASHELEVTFHRGAPAPEVIKAFGAPEVELGVCGARRALRGAGPAGRTALAVISESATPVVVVPPGFSGWADETPLHALVPLDGTEEAALPVQHLLAQLATAGVVITLLHVFDRNTTPAFLDQPYHGLTAWGHEFVTRFSDLDKPPRVQLRVGDPARQVTTVAAEELSDLVVVGWTHHLSPGHARVVRELLARCDVPTLLVPYEP